MARPKAITSLKDSPTQGKRNWLIYADSGTGKTVLAGTAPKALFLTVEAAGTESAKALGSAADEWVVSDWKTLQEAYNWLKQEGVHEYEWVLVDSVSEMEELCWKDHLQEAHEANSNRSLYQPAIQDYQIISNKIKRLVDSFNRLPINVLYTAQTMRLEIENEETDDDTTLLSPLLGTRNGVLSQKVCAMVTLVGLLRVQTPKDKEVEPYRRLWLQGSRRYTAKDRHDTFPRYLDTPNIEEMADAVTKRQEKMEKDKPASTRRTRKAAVPEEGAA